MATYFPAYPNLGRLIRKYPLTAAQTFKEGAAVYLVAAGTVSECGADPASILGFAAHDAGADPDTGDVLVYIAHAEATFLIQGSAAPVVADVGDAYGIVKDASGTWILDKTEAVNTRVTIEKVFISRLQYEVRVLAANRQLG